MWAYLRILMDCPLNYGNGRERGPEELPVQLRPFMPSDLNRIMEIEEASFKGDAYRRAQFEKLHKDQADGFYVAEIFGEAIGYVIGSVSGDVGVLDSLAVDRRFRDLGIGRRLVDLILERFREKGIQTCSLRVRTTNGSAVRFYKGVGFQIVKTVDALEPGVQAYLMKMNL